MKKLFFLFAILFYSFSVFCQSNPAILKNKNDLLVIGKNADYLEDADGKLTIQDILQPAQQAKFQKQERDVFARPGTPSAFWFRVTVQNQTSEDAWLDVATTYAWYIDFYEIDSVGKVKFQHKTGNMFSDNTKFYDVNTYWLPVNKAYDNTPRTYYLRIEEGLAFEMPLQLGTIRSLSKNKDLNDFFTAAFIGIMLIMFLYNSFLYVSTKDHIYAYYLGYLFMMTIAMTYATNYPFILQLESIGISRYYLNNYFLWWHTPAYLCVGMFCIRYLNLNKERGNFARISIQVVLTVIFIDSSLIWLGLRPADVVNIEQGFIMILYLVCLSTAYYFAFKGDRQARYYALGWTFMISIVFIFFAVVNGFLPFSPYSRNTLYFGVVAEIWLFSLALADRINIMRGEKEQMQAEKLQIIKEQNNTLENKVRDRTKDLYEANVEMQALNEELHTTVETLQETKAVVDAKNEHILASINYANRIQQAILPSLQSIKNYLDIFVFYLPKDIVSGDFYWFAEKENKILIAVGDCTGHGVPGALMSMLGTEIINKIVHNLEIHQPNKILKLLSEGVSKALKQQETGMQDGMDIIIISIDKSNQIVEYSGAMNPLFYVQNNEMTEIKADKTPIGGTSFRKVTQDFNTHNIAIDTPTMFYLCSDGFQDQFGGTQNKKYLTKNMKNFFLKISQETTNNQQRLIQQEFQSWKGKQQQIDDVLIIGIKM